MQSGRWCRTFDTKHGWAALHAWEGGRWEVSRGGQAIASGSEWTNKVEDAMQAAETWLGNLIETEP